jgi:NAD-dependent dihydropyrimidine dehydrogenase PreA subunit
MRYLLNGNSLVLDSALCSGCGMCVDVCPHAVFAIADRKAVIVNRDGCMECGACKMNCFAKAIAVDSGVGCAAAVVNGIRRGDGSASCDCG